MKNKPLYLIVYPILSCLIAASFPLQIHYLYKIPLSDMNKIFSMLTPLNILTMLTLTISAVLVMTLHKSIYKIIPALLTILFINNAVVGLYGTDFTLIQVALSFVLFSVSLKPFYNQNVKSVIMNPKLRWWKTPKRYNIEKSVLIEPNRLNIDSEALNFSKTGVYVKIESDTELDQFIVEDILNLVVGSEEIPLQAKVVRIVRDNTGFPNGVGLEFIKDENHKNEFIPWFKEQVKSKTQTEAEVVLSK